MNASELKSILTEMMAEIEHLQATLEIVVLRQNQPTTKQEAHEAKRLRLEANAEHFSRLRKRIEGLA